MPAGTRVILAAGHGASFWTRTARVDTVLPDKTPMAFFLKVGDRKLLPPTFRYLRALNTDSSACQIASGERGRGMMRGEFESMTAIQAVSPSFAPKPVAWGTFKSNSELHFFLCDFHEMDGETPNAKTFTARLAEMHQKPVSPTGKYGFHLTTYNGNLPQDCTWTETWEECYRNNLSACLVSKKRLVDQTMTSKISETQYWTKL